MTGDDLRAVRLSLGLSLVQMGRALGYQGTRETLNAQIHKYEAGQRPIPPWIARLVIMYDRFGLPDDLRPE